MTPFEIDVLLHYHTRATDCEACINNVPIWAETRNKFVGLGLLEQDNTENDRAWRLTDKGTCYVVDGLCNVPLPVQRWEIQYIQEAA